MKNRDAEFTDYVTANRTRCRRTAYLLCGDWILAEDIVQQALIKLYLVWHRVRQDGADGYLRRIISRTAIDEWRRASRRRTVPDDGLIDLAADTDIDRLRAAVGVDRRPAAVTGTTAPDRRPPALVGSPGGRGGP